MPSTRTRTRRAPRGQRSAAPARKRKPAQRTKAAKSCDPQVQRVSHEPWTLRRWEAADTDRTNKAHWQNATGQGINADLVDNLKTLRARCCFEAANNSLVEGMIFTHAVDIVGQHGPRLQVLSDSPEYNQAFEQLFREWWEMPDAAEILSGPEMMRQWVNLWWTKGEHLLQTVTADEVRDDQISLRILSLDPDRLDTDPNSFGDPNVALGVRRNKFGRPLSYQISQLENFGAFQLLSTRYEEYSADEIIHHYECTEPGQVRGFPWLASSLTPIAELRDLDTHVLDTSKLAASQGVVWYTEHDDAPFVEVAASRKMERNSEQTGPPGWKPMVIDPKQPSPQHVAYRTERLRELGRGKSIPLMKILLGSERHNFASARMDNQNYQRSNEAIEGSVERSTLNPLANAVQREGMLLRRRGRPVLPPRPATVVLKWLWPKQPHVDSEKEYKAQRLEMENGTLPFAEACALAGRDEDEVIKSRKSTAQKLRDAGLPPVPAPQVPVPQAEIDKDGFGSPDDDSSDVDPDEVISNA